MSYILDAHMSMTIEICWTLSTWAFIQ